MDPVSRAQAGNKQETPKYANRIDRVKGHRWQKGQSGNPSGRPKKLHITKIFEKLLAKSDNRKEISEAIMATLTSKGMAKVLMLREMAERTEGKVTQEVDMNVNGTITLEQVLEARKKADK
jgi:hypothetical protein